MLRRPRRARLQPSMTDSTIASEFDLPEELESAKEIAQLSFDSLKAAVVADMRKRLG